MRHSASMSLSDGMLFFKPLTNNVFGYLFMWDKKIQVMNHVLIRLKSVSNVALCMVLRYQKEHYQ